MAGRFFTHWATESPIHTHIYTCTHIYMHTYIHAHIYTHTHIYTYIHTYLYGLLWWLSGKKSSCQRKRHRRSRFDPWVGKIPWRRKRTHSSILVWEIPWTEKAGRLRFMGSQRVGHYLATEQHIYVCVCICRNIYTNTQIYMCFCVCVYIYIHI